MAGKVDTSIAAQDSLSSEAFEMWNLGEMKSGQLQTELVDVKKTSLEDDSEEDARKELVVLLGRVEAAAASLRYLRSKGEDRLTGTSKSQDSLVIEDGAYTWDMLQSIQMVTDLLESLLRRVTAAESETLFQTERVIIAEEELRRKTVQIEDLSLRLDEMKRFVLGNKTVLDETAEIIEKLVEDSRRDREKAVENEEELRRMKTECESLRNYISSSTSVIESLLSSQQFQIEARLVAKSTQLESEKAQKEVEVQKLMEENVKLTALLDKKEAQLLALNEQCKLMALNASNI